ncbi:MAG TPA: class I SAM-dependent methyltransferase [Candidatus Limnocylindria bacterium]|nr:class I SAM-dependent methyltransferase [Candidatus Limnocylindria bacterium]
MGFDVAAEAYDRFMGRYSRLLAPQLADLASVSTGQRVLDVGCGPGALTSELVARLGADAVAAVDPSPPFVAAIRARLPGVAVQEASASSLPFADGAFDAVLAQLVVHFMPDPEAGIAEMTRVCTSGGVVAACVWDIAGGRAPHSPFWQAVHDLFGDAEDESERPGARAGHLVSLFKAVGLSDVVERELVARREHASFEEWWEPYEEGVGPAGQYVAALSPDARGALRDRCRVLLPEPPFTISSVAWAARGRA